MNFLSDLKRALIYVHHIIIPPPQGRVYLAREMREAMEVTKVTKLAGGVVVLGGVGVTVALMVVIMVVTVVMGSIIPVHSVQYTV